MYASAQLLDLAENCSLPNWKLHSDLIPFLDGHLLAFENTIFYLHFMILLVINTALLKAYENISMFFT